MWSEFWPYVSMFAGLQNFPRGKFYAVGFWNVTEVMSVAFRSKQHSGDVVAPICGPSRPVLPVEAAYDTK